MDILQLVESTVPITSSVIYSCSLTNTWSAARHPIEYPSGRATWSPPVLVAHSKVADLWSPGDFATPGIEKIAEQGNTETLEAELEVLHNYRFVGDSVVGEHQSNRRDPIQVFEPLILSPKYPYLSTISMIGPSPDWFSGIDSFSARGPEGYWYQNFEIATYPFDAGTEQGDLYTLNNTASVPHGPIYQLTVDTVPDNGVFLDPTGTTVLPVATWACDLVGEGVSPENPSDLNLPAPGLPEIQSEGSGGLRGSTSGNETEEEDECCWYHDDYYYYYYGGKSF